MGWLIYFSGYLVAVPLCLWVAHGEGFMRKSTMEDIFLSLCGAFFSWIIVFFCLLLQTVSWVETSDSFKMFMKYRPFDRKDK